MIGPMPKMLSLLVVAALTAGCAQWRETGRQAHRRDLEQRDRVGQAVQAVGAEGDEPHAGW